MAKPVEPGALIVVPSLGQIAAVGDRPGSDRTITHDGADRPVAAGGERPDQSVEAAATHDDRSAAFHELKITNWAQPRLGPKAPFGL